MKIKAYIFSLLALGCTSCDDYFSGMDIKNEYSPDISMVMKDASQYPSLLSGICGTYWSALLGYGNSAFWCMASNADQYAAGAGNWNFTTWMYYDGMDKSEIDNNDESAAFPKDVWYDFYGMINTLKDVIAALDNGAEYLEGGKETNYKVYANAYFLMGMCYTEMSLLFDQCFLLTETTDMTSLSAENIRPAKEIQAAALDYLDKCIALCDQNGNFSNISMFPNGTMDSGDKLRKMANFMAARCLAYFPRTNEEYSDVDWQKVASYAGNGIQEDIVASLPDDVWGNWTLVQQAHATTGWGRVGMRILEMMCPDDSNAVWPLPRDFDSNTQLPEFNSPDARLKTDFTYTPEFKSNAGVSFSGYTKYSPYSLNRFNDYVINGIGTEYLFTLAECELIYAEALVNTGNVGDASAIINKTRVGRGNLPAMASSSTKDDMMKALYYERFIESDFPYPATPFYDRRRTPVDEFQLSTRSWRQLPVPCYELNYYGVEVYTFGGEKDANPKYKF